MPCDEEVTTTPERRALRRDKSKGGEAERKEGAQTGLKLASNYQSLLEEHAWLFRPLTLVSHAVALLSAATTQLLREANSLTQVRHDLVRRAIGS